MTSPAVDRPFRGLALETSVLKKIYYQNAVDWLGGWEDQPASAAAGPLAAPAGAAQTGQLVVPRARGTEESFTFAVVGDSRGGGFFGGLRGTVVKDAPQLIINKIAESEPAFVVNTGDLVKQGAEKKEWREFEKMNQVFKDKNILYCPILGNHEYGGPEEKELAGYFECFPALNNQLWYTLTYGNCGFIMLDTNFSKLSQDQATRQRQWLEETLAKYQADTAIAFVVVFLHHPPYHEFQLP